MFLLVHSRNAFIAGRARRNEKDRQRTIEIENCQKKSSKTVLSVFTALFWEAVNAE